MPGTAWITTRESVDGRPPVTSRTRLIPERPVSVGRDGGISLGVSVPDTSVSRVALTVTAGPDGWSITDTSRNGLVLHPWGLAPARAGTAVRLRWPLVAIRVLGADAATHHWVLLEDDRYRPDEDGRSARPGTTVGATPPRPLTPAEVAALTTVFAAFLAWPPALVPAEPLQLKQAARVLGVTASAVKVRLEGARAKAYQLGLDRTVGVTAPEYLHVLVAAAYVLPPLSGG